MVVLPPGTLLQFMYLEERLKGRKPGRFIEIGAGSGELTRILLKAGWSGIVYELSKSTAMNLKDRFFHEIFLGRLVVIQGDYLNSIIQQKEDRVDLVISSMVMEHMDHCSERKFLEISKLNLKTDGIMIGFVPASPQHWGIEDDIAGHQRRYTKESLSTLLQVSGWEKIHIAGLTYPLSNLLFPISNYLVQRSESDKLKLSLYERTKRSGQRNVRFKTKFPGIMKLFLNKWAMIPLYWIQKLFIDSDNALVIYFEASYKSRFFSNET